MLRKLNSRITHYAVLLTSALTLVVAGGANLNCGAGPSPKTVASSSVRDPDLRDPEGGLLWDRENPRPAEVELSNTVTLADGTEVPVTGWHVVGAGSSVRTTFEDPANPNVAVIRPEGRPRTETTIYFELEFRYPASGARGVVEYMLRVRAGEGGER